MLRLRSMASPSMLLVQRWQAHYYACCRLVTLGQEQLAQDELAACLTNSAGCLEHQFALRAREFGQATLQGIASQMARFGFRAGFAGQRSHRGFAGVGVDVGRFGRGHVL